MLLNTGIKNSLWVKEYDEKNETKREQHIKILKQGLNY